MRGFPCKGPWAVVLEQTQVSREKLGQVFVPEGLASVVTMLAPPCILLLAWAMLDTGEAQFWESCWIPNTGRNRLWAAQHWQGRVFMYTSCRRDIDVLRMWLLRLGS